MAKSVLDMTIKELIEEAQGKALKAAEVDTLRVAEFAGILKRMREFKVEVKPPSFNSKNPYYSKGDEDAPFFTEGFLYPLLGKEDARTVLSYMSKLEDCLESLSASANETKLRLELEEAVGTMLRRPHDKAGLDGVYKVWDRLQDAKVRREAESRRLSAEKRVGLR